MADPEAHLPVYDGKNTSNSSSIEKKLQDNVVVVDPEPMKEVEETEDRIINDEAIEADYRVGEAHEVAVKVTLT